MNKKVKFIVIVLLCAFAYIGFTVINWLLYILYPLFFACIIIYLYLKFNNLKQKKVNVESMSVNEENIEEAKNETIDDLLNQIENERKL